MSARSRSNSGPAFCLLLATMLALPCRADGLHPADPLENYRTTKGVQGMFAVRAAAIAFLKGQPAPKDGHWLALLPDVRTFVPSCAVPLRTRWAVAADQETPMPGVLVSCPRSTDKSITTWNAFVGARKVQGAPSAPSKSAL